MSHIEDMANKTRNWRPSEGYYQTIREALPEEFKHFNDQEMVDYHIGRSISGQCESLPLANVEMPEWGENQSESLSKLNERIEIIAASIQSNENWGEQIETLQLGMKQLHQQMRVLKDDLKVLKQASGFV